MTDRITDFISRRDLIRSELGGTDKVERIHAQGRRTIREHIDAFCDPGSFDELGTFARSANPADVDTTPGDGKIGGHAKVGGRPVTVFGDDITVRRGSSSMVASRKIERLTEHALKAGNPIVHFGQTGGARIPDTLGTEGFVQVTPRREASLRRRRVPLATLVVHLRALRFRGAGPGHLPCGDVAPGVRGRHRRADLLRGSGRRGGARAHHRSDRPVRGQR
jgi:acetyl-CoA carboxylase carboxyltransferase component